jgi:hypothetical protein
VAALCFNSQEEGFSFQNALELEIIANKKFLSCLNELREHARRETKESKSPVVRLMQVEERLKGV